MQARKRLAAATLAAVALMAAGTAHATVLNVYTDPALWQAATTSYSLIDFEGILNTTGTVQAYSTSSGLTLGGVQFVGVRQVGNYELLLINPATGWGSNFNSGSLLRGPANFADPFEQSLLINLPAGVTAFGLDLMSQDPSALSFKIVLSTGEQYTNVATQSNPTRTFFGLTADTAISQISLILEGNVVDSYALIDNFRYGATYIAPPPPPPEETAELTTLMYVATGFLILFVSRRMRRLTTSS